MTKKLTHLLFVICLSISLYLIIETKLFLKGALRTTAEITHIEYEHHGSGQPTHWPTFTFVDKSGISREIKPSYASKNTSYRLGQKILVYYDPARLSHARIDNFTSLWQLPFITSCFAFALFILSLSPKLLKQNIFGKKMSQPYDIHSDMIFYPIL